MINEEELLELLQGIKNDIIVFLEQGQIENAELFMEQYIKLSPHNIDRYSLEAIINTEKGDFKKANQVLLEGVKFHPISFDLLYNLGCTFQHLGECLEAYHIYMKAKYIAETEDEKQDIVEALKSLVNDFSGITRVDDNTTTIIVKAGSIELTLTMEHEDILEKKEILNTIEKNIHLDSKEVLEIGFEDGIISKNLNSFGFDVIAVDRIKERILSVIAREWHDNILQPEQKSASFYHEDMSLEWLEMIPLFDTIIAVSKDGLDAFNIKIGHKDELLKLLFLKSKRQIILRVAVDKEDDISVEDILTLRKSFDFDLKTIDLKDKDYKICIINKASNQETFSIPSPFEVKDSKSIILEVDLSKCKDLYGAAYVGDFQHFVEVLKEYQENPNLSYEDSSLKEYYDTFQPRNLEEGLFSKAKEVPRLKKGWIGYPWNYDRDKRVIFTEKIKETRLGGIHHFGPNSLEFGKDEFDRLMALYNSFKAQEYAPEVFSDGYITGYLLIKDDDYRFVVTEGQHRAGALGALGYTKVRVKLNQRPQFPQIVEFKDMKNWPQVENKTYSRTLAAKVFWRFFEEGVGKDRMDFK